METPAQNRQADADEHRIVVQSDENRQKHIKEVGPHEHAWAFYGMGAEGGRYEVCEICGTRRVANIPLISALHKDWVEGTGKFEPDGGKAETKAKSGTAAASGHAGHKG